MDWTAETLMQRHRSRPYNPNIANAFFRAGYVESWGRGIQKIRESCEVSGIALPEYMVHSGDIMVKLSALPTDKVGISKAPKHQSTEVGALKLEMEQGELAELTGSRQQVISRIEKRENSPSLKSFCNILNALGYELKIVKRGNV